MRPKAFDLNLLGLVATLDETRSVTRAAVKLGMSQPGLSTALRRLRRDFEDPMFVRSADGMNPTPRGAAVAKEARQILEQVNARVLNQPLFDPLTKQTQIRLAVPDVGEMLILPLLYPEFSKTAPLADIQTQSIEPHQLEGMLASGAIDLAIGYYPAFKGGGLMKEQLVTQGFSCMMRKGHPAAGNLTREVFSRLEHVVVENALRSQELVDNYLDKRGVVRKIRIRTAHYLSVPMVVMNTDLIATVPAAAGRIFASMAKVQLVDLPYAIPKYAVLQYWHRRFDNDPRNRWVRTEISRLMKRGGGTWM